MAKFFVLQFICIIFTFHNTKSQNISLPIGTDIYLLPLFQNSNFLKAPIKPGLVNYSQFNQIHDSIYRSNYNKNPIFIIKPTLDNSFYTGFSNKKNFQTQNGFKLLAAISNKLTFNLNYSFYLSSLPDFAEQKIDSTYIIPNYSKANSTGQNYYFNDLIGEIIFNPTSFLNLILGNKHTFLGNGYRSLFLSNTSGNYYNFKSLVNVWNINYLFQTSLFSDINKNEPPYELKKKFGTFHFISWDVTPRINLNFFESVIWAPDDSTINRGYDINYLNPVVFFRPVEFSVGSSDNVLLGLGGNIEILKNTLVYSQFILDEFNLSFIRETEKWWANKFGYQFGLKYWLQNNHNSIIFNLEHNWVRPFTYTHAYSSKSYGNTLQPLAHPLGANFKEWVSSINYSKKRFFLENVFIFQQYGTDSISTNYGNNIYLSSDTRSLDYGSTILQGIKNNVTLNRFTLSYLIYPNWFTFLDFSVLYRHHSFEGNTNNNFYLSLGIRTGIKRNDVFDHKY